MVYKPKHMVPLAAAFLFFGLAVSAHAGPRRDQQLLTPPLHGPTHKCAAINGTDEPLNFSMSLCGADGACFVQDDFEDVEPGGFEGGSYFVTGWSYCKFTWYGRKGDLIASHCIESATEGEVRVGCVSNQ